MTKQATPVIIESATELAHEANRLYCASIGDFTQVDWCDAPVWQRDSAKQGVQKVIDGLDPAGLHQSWVEAKIADGWRYGEVKDAEVKTHPCIVAFDKLPEEQRRKDYLFHDVVASFLLAVGVLES